MATDARHQGFEPTTAPERQVGESVKPATNVAASTSSGAEPRYCYVHIGTHKTGTTSIQAFLAANRQRFNEHGVYLPSAGTVDDLGVIAHHQLALDLSGNPAFDARRGGLSEITSELRATTARVACLSSEDFTFLHASPRRTLATYGNDRRSSGCR